MRLFPWFLFMFLWGSSSAWSATVHRFPITPAQQLNVLIGDLMGGRISPSDFSQAVLDNPSTPLAKAMGLSNALFSYRNVKGAASLAALLEVTNSLIYYAGEPLTDSQRELMRQRLSPFFVRFEFEPQDNFRTRLVHVYNLAHLWAPEDFWLLKHYASDAIKNVPYLEAMLELRDRLSAAELEELDTELKKNDGSLTILTRYQLGVLAAENYLALLKQLYSDMRVRSEAETSSDDLIRLYERKTLRRRLSIGALQDLQRRYNAGDQDVIKAVQQLYASSPNALAKMFARLFERNGFENMALRYPKIKAIEELDPLGLRSLVQRESPAAMSVEDRNDNVFRVNFGYNYCRQLFLR